MSHSDTIKVLQQCYYETIKSVYKKKDLKEISQRIKENQTTEQSRLFTHIMDRL